MHAMKNNTTFFFRASLQSHMLFSINNKVAIKSSDSTCYRLSHIQKGGTIASRGKPLSVSTNVYHIYKHDVHDSFLDSGSCFAVIYGSSPVFAFFLEPGLPCILSSLQLRPKSFQCKSSRHVLLRISLDCAST